MKALARFSSTLSLLNEINRNPCLFFKVYLFEIAAKIQALQQKDIRLI